MKYYDYILSDFKVNFMIYIPLSIILQSCIGSIAAMYILLTSTKDVFPFFQLTLCVIVSMAYNASVLAQLSHKLIFYMLVLSILINVLLIVINL